MKICTNCNHYLSEFEVEKGVLEHRCKRTSERTTNLITGERNYDPTLLRYCGTERGFGTTVDKGVDICGEEGKYYEDGGKYYTEVGYGA